MNPEKRVVFRKIPNGPKLNPLTWMEWPENKSGIIAECCCIFGHCGTLRSQNHNVDNEGNVMPSYVCPVPGCSFHDFIKLDSWK
jgi:hypothetical protein